MRGFPDQSPMMQALEAPRASRPVSLARETNFRLGALSIRPSLREVQAGARRQIIEPRVMQVLVALARMEGYSVEEIAAQLGFSPRSIKRKLQMIRSIWAKELDP